MLLNNNNLLSESKRATFLGLSSEKIPLLLQFEIFWRISRLSEKHNADRSHEEFHEEGEVEKHTHESAEIPRVRESTHARIIRVSDTHANRAHQHISPHIGRSFLRSDGGQHGELGIRYLLNPLFFCREFRDRN